MLKYFTVSAPADWQNVIDHLLLTANNKPSKDFLAHVNYKRRIVLTLKLTIDRRVSRLILNPIDQRRVPDDAAHEAAQALLGERYAEPLLPYRVGARHFYTQSSR